MKTETQIAEEKIKSWREHESTPYRLVRLASCKSHKASSQRFLEFLEEEMKRWETINEISSAYISTGELEEKIQDLKQAIKLYDENGI